MLLPKKVKHRKWHKPRRGNKGIATRINTVAFGSHGVVALGHTWITSRQIEAARRVLTRYVRRGGKVWIRIFPDRPVTKKGSEVPMGKGKGAPDHYVCTIKPGTVMFEIGGIPEDKAVEALNLAGYKLPTKVKVVKKHL
ncbi:MAG: 50S ribosomal protein L16 [Candidatus Magasanikbacteria bacterium CG11_big_fil_rev_8_21_14_0_20_39_34]|uniref:Large ribosomal subunit protein uL16 n=1 Tax=Candidatus Magasanikbacteria bacterium CG11_big_fil_rev_8_21_14_0_20_39_34 TaxID=1974653 RepID=A0A2H0N3V3_9BACT|nr:MAG: 50S ribosomal protein L16 [Candidatus Magasanikbacteria bacterium CG11_big_fil_rev_8_21_14_0_20_39_34]